MRLYNITFAVTEDELQKTLLIPYIPKCPGPNEDKTTPRVCLSDSITKCLQAMPYDSRNIRENVHILVRSAEINSGDENLVYPTYLAREGLVPDALENQEYWYLEPLQVSTKEYILEDYEESFDVSWTLVDKTDMQAILSKYLPKFSKMADFSSSAKELYEQAVDYCEERELWDEEDIIWEDITNLPYVQKKLSAK